MFNFFKKKESLPNGTILTDGSCLVRGDCLYHTTVGCESKWRDETHNAITDWKRITVQEAKKQKLTYCYECSREMYFLKKREKESEK